MALDFSKIEMEVVGLSKRGKTLTLMTFKDFMGSSLVLNKLQTYTGCCRMLENQIETYNSMIEKVRENDGDEMAANRMNTLMVGILKVQNSLKLIQDNYTLQLIAEASLLPRYLFE